jgi:hypothetical protein
MTTAPTLSNFAGACRERLAHHLERDLGGECFVRRRRVHRRDTAAPMARGVVMRLVATNNTPPPRRRYQRWVLQPAQSADPDGFWLALAIAMLFFAGIIFMM